MRTLFPIFLAILALPVFSQNNNLTLVDTVEFPGQNLSNIWGYSDGTNEYALVGAANGLYIIDVTNPSSPTRIEQLTDGISSSWREVKTYNNTAYIVSEGLDSSDDGGVGIADLSDLPNTPVPFVKYTGDGPISNQLHRAHALDVDEATGYAYIYGTTGLANKGAVCLDLTPDPDNPTYAGQYNTNYIHDGYTNNNIVYGSHVYAGYFSIIDFTNKSSPVVLATQTTPNAFTHNTWPSADGNYLFTTDEKSNSYLTCYDISNPNNITEMDRIRTTPGSGSIVHNTYIKGNHAVTSWYRDGITITDVSRPHNLIQVANYDTYPWATGNGFQGAWGVYPYLPSGNILVSNIQQPLNSGGQGGVMFILSSSYPNACFLEGTVTDVSTGTELFGVGVEIQHTDPLNSTTSKLDGSYATGQPTSGTFDVEFSRLGFVTETVSVSLSNGAVTFVDVELLPLSLPLEMLSFSAKQDGKQNVLNWSTAQEVNTAKHEIQRKRNPDEHWQMIGEVAAAGTTQIETSYEFIDENPYPECHYRLRTMDLDGQEYYSDIVYVERANEAFSIEMLYPIPSNGSLELQILSDEFREGTLLVGNYEGKVLLEQQVDLHVGKNKLQLQLPTEWPNGQYWLRVDGQVRVLLEHFLLER